MTDVTTLNQQLAELQRQRSAAAKAEIDRQQRENQHRDQVAQLEREIAQAQAGRREAMLAEAVATNDELISVAAEAADALREALDSLDLRAIMPAFERYGEAFDRQQQHKMTAAGDYLVGARLPNPWGDYAGTSAVGVIRAEYVRVYGGFRNALTPVSVLAAWVAGAYDNPAQKRIRQGIAYALLGKVVSPVRDYDPQRATADELQRRVDDMLRF